jgi:hypothetical protein
MRLIYKHIRLDKPKKSGQAKMEQKKGNKTGG